ncbi:MULTISPECIES: ABC transporter permease [Microbacterium]|jgi:ABC-2 type transport system permease protein|uniref:ABC transporter permease n=1 Tax=Microbacterium TaxID=33882 RepID=UPI001D17BD8D|nr:ABC transporter permease [Microbacterium testaceum]MCC4250589.1 ABC transporter permease [Microbacterium testaceum]
MNGTVAGTGPLLRASIRYDGRRSFVPWTVVVTVLAASSVLVFPWIFPEEADRAALATAVGANPALSLILGPAFDLTTSDGFAAWRSLALGGFLAALGAIFTVVRATREQEDSGQAELLASGVLGRASRLLTGVAMAAIGSLLVGVVAAGATVACGGDVVSSLLLGATFTATGWMFTGVAAVAGQVGSEARTASSLAVGVLGVLFVLRGFSYAVEAPEWTLWANPLGWMTETRPASGDDAWPLVWAVVFAAALVSVAFALQARRDFGQGVIAPRPGPARGRVRSTGALAARINAPSAVVWVVAFLALGLVFGYFVTSIQDLLGDNPAVAQVLAAGATTSDELVSAFLLTVVSLLGILAAIPGVQVVLRMRTEEVADRAEPVLAAGVHRSTYLGSNLVVGLGLSTACVVLAGLLVAVLAAGADIGITFGDAIQQSLVSLPAVWSLVAVAAVVFAARPQVAVAAWVGVVAAFGLTILGPTFDLSDEVLAISPFWHIPVIEEGADLTGVFGTVAVVALLLGLSFAAFRRRDIAR